MFLLRKYIKINEFGCQIGLQMSQPGFGDRVKEPPPQNHPKGDLHPKLHFHNQIITEINDLEALFKTLKSNVEIRNRLVKEPSPKPSKGDLPPKLYFHYKIITEMYDLAALF